MYYNLCMNKNQRIGMTRRETKRRHSNMTCRTFEIKAVSNKMNREQKESVNGIFREAKWIRNALINDMHCLEDNFKKVPVKVGDEIEMRELKYIGSQMKQSMVKSVHSELKALHTKKEKGEKVGALKFKSYCNSVNLKQYGITYSIDFAHNRIKIQGIKKSLYVRGLKQIPADAEFANAKLVRKADGCISVEMEGSAVQAVCDFRGYEVYMFFTGEDLLDAPEWTIRKEKCQIRHTQHDPGHFDIALALAEYVVNLK